MRYLMTFSYDGTNYNGYQKQPDLITIQEVIETALTKINSNKPVSIHASGRTDSKVHALNQKATARRASRDLNKKYEDCNFIVAHMGGGISVGAHLKGNVIDVANALDGEGPFSPERSGGLPVGDLVKMCFSGKYTQDDIKKKIKGNGGLVAYLNTNDGREVEAMIEAGNEKAKLVYEAMAYQVAKEIGACAAVLKGDIDSILLTGGIAYSKLFTNMIIERVNFLGEVKVYPGEDEMIALAQGGLRVLNKDEEAKVYGKELSIANIL